MKGTIVRIDLEQGTGTILGEDDWEYGFLPDEVNGNDPLEVGCVVEFESIQVAFTIEQVAVQVVITGGSAG